MTQYVLKRIFWALFVVAAVITGVFVLMFGFGDPAQATLPRAGPEQLEDFRRKQGLHESLTVQYLSYLGVTPCVREASPKWNEDESKREHCGLLQGDFGESYGHKEPVARVVWQRLPRTLLLSGIALTIEIILGLLFGILAATKKNSWFDTGFMASAFLGISLPTFVTGPIFLLVFAFLYGWFPVGGYGVDFWDHVYHALLPAFTLAIVGAATYARIMRSEMIETLRSDYIRTAKAKGLSHFQVVVKHGVRNALLPIVTLMGLSMAILVSGAIITENIFAWPGMGSLAIESIHNLDAPTVLAVVLIFSITVQIGNLLADIAVAYLDPRVRLGG